MSPGWMADDVGHRLPADLGGRGEAVEELFEVERRRHVAGSDMEFVGHRLPRGRVGLARRVAGESDAVVVVVLRRAATDNGASTRCMSSRSTRYTRTPTCWPGRREQGPPPASGSQIRPVSSEPVDGGMAGCGNWVQRFGTAVAAPATAGALRAPATPAPDMPITAIPTAPRIRPPRPGRRRTGPVAGADAALTQAATLRTGWCRMGWRVHVWPRPGRARRAVRRHADVRWRDSTVR